ncbi:hypothetical protein NUW54_g12200 [Trametes sanguinea]|uniref:Uncharacterized protein n=1 Tax=Trametes sanguinea TaxID=158606 RepID=A0ACC1N2R5_9APHY|nr:hypothetical protein NUW54_g12200 [Trametes sanguinea]
MRAPLYPNPSSHGHSALLRFSNSSILSAFWSVSAMSSSPFSRQCRRNASTWNAHAGFPLARRTSCFSRSTSSSRPCSASSASSRHSLLAQDDGEHAVLERVVLEDVREARRDDAHDAEVLPVDTEEEPISITPESNLQNGYTHNAQGACSRELPHPKLCLSHTKIFACVYGSRLSTKSVGVPSAFQRKFANSASFRPVRFSTLRNRAGMIMSVSMFSTCSGAAMPFSTLNGATFDGGKEPRDGTSPLLWSFLLLNPDC